MSRAIGVRQGELRDFLLTGTHVSLDSIYERPDRRPGALTGATEPLRRIPHPPTRGQASYLDISGVSTVSPLARSVLPTPTLLATMGRPTRVSSSKFLVPSF